MGSANIQFIAEALRAQRFAEVIVDFRTTHYAAEIMAEPHYYTVEEANALLPQLTQVLVQMQAQARQHTMVQSRIEDVTKTVKSNGHHNPIEDPMVSQVSRALGEAIRDGLNQLADWNIELKDVSTGLVDFPALREGRVVYLCWKLGELRVAYWHDIEAGFAGRQPLDEKSL